MQEFPKWMYHRTEAARIVDDPIEQDALGPDWAETPAAFDGAGEHVNGVATEVMTAKRGRR